MPMEKSQRPLSPHLQIYRFQLTSVLSITHRATGMALVLGTLVLVYWLLAAASSARTPMKWLRFTKQLIVFCDAVRAARGARLDLAGTHGHSQVRNGRVFCLTGAV